MWPFRPPAVKDPAVSDVAELKLMDVRRLRLRPGETLVVQVKNKWLSEEEQERVHVYLKANLPEGVKSMVIGGDIELAVVTKNGAEQPA